jgi:hypothetical protein
VLTELAPQTPLDLARRAEGKVRWLRSNYEIVIPRQATSQEQKAAYELEFWLEQMTGVAMPVVTDEAHDKNVQKRRAIHVGVTSGYRKAGFKAPDATLGDEGYAISVKDGDLFLVGGRRRGPINAVLALLEEDLGCRWLPGDVNVTAHRPELSFRPVPRRHVPAFEGREPFYFESLSPIWSLRNRTNSTHVPIPDAWGGFTFWALRTHSHLLLVPPEKYFDSHPEYYGQRRASSERDSHYLCLTNPEVLSIAVDRLRSILRDNPGSRAAVIGQEDGGHHGCFCDRCTALNDQQGTQQATHLAFVNAIAQTMEKEFPGVTFCTYAYAYTVAPPQTLRARANVGVRLCNTDTFDEPFTAMQDHDLFRRHFLGWKAVCNNLFIYDYWAHPEFPKAPTPNMDMIARNIRWLAEQKVREVSGLGTGTWYPLGDRSEMRTWVTAKLLWNPKWDHVALARDFIEHYYGKAAPAMLEYEKLLARDLDLNRAAMKRPAEGRRYPITAPLYSPAFLSEAEALLDRAHRSAETDAIRQRVERVQNTIAFVREKQRPSK